MTVKMSIAEIAVAEALCRRRVPEHLHEGIRRYLADGVLPGHFLRAVLENDLAQAFLRGDPESLAGLRSIVMFLYFDAPLDSWGSASNVRAWALDRRRPIKEGNEKHD